MNVIEGVTVLNEIIIYKDAPVLIIILAIIAIVGGAIFIGIGAADLGLSDIPWFFCKGYSWDSAYRFRDSWRVLCR